MPLWWDEGTLADLSGWKRFRESCGAGATSRFVCSVRNGSVGRSINRHVLRRRFRTACNCLGAARSAYLTIHHGRHTFVSHALAGGRTLAEVRDAAGHASVHTTSVYLHASVADSAGGDLFEFEFG